MNNRKLEYNDTGFSLSFVSKKKEVRNAYKGDGLVEAIYFLLNITSIYPIFSNKKNPIYVFVKSRLTTCTISFLFRLYFV
jgi:hypothetical protein